jgi:hypothetical protein
MLHSLPVFELEPYGKLSSLAMMFLTQNIFYTAMS